MHARNSIPSTGIVVESYFMMKQVVVLEDVNMLSPDQPPHHGQYVIVNGADDVQINPFASNNNADKKRFGPTGMLCSTTGRGAEIRIREHVVVPLILDICRPAWAPRASEFFDGLACIDFDIV